MLAAMTAMADMSNPDAHGKICGGDGRIRHKLPVTSFQLPEKRKDWGFAANSCTWSAALFAIKVTSRQFPVTRKRRKSAG
jgi:hypothetical protein